MPTRVLLEKGKIRVSKPGFDAASEPLNPDGLILYENMPVMAVYVAGQCYLAGEDARHYVNFPKPIPNMPYVIMNSDDGACMGRESYCFETSQDNGLYRGGVIRNIDGVARNIWFSILRGF